MSLVIGFGIGGEQRRRGHQLPALAIAALRHFELDPGALQRLAGRRLALGLDGAHLGLADGRDRGDAGAARLAVHMDGARAAQRNAAAVLGAGEPELIAQHPEHGRIALDVHLGARAIHTQLECHLPPSRNHARRNA